MTNVQPGLYRIRNVQSKLDAGCEVFDPKRIICVQEQYPYSAIEWTVEALGAFQYCLLIEDHAAIALKNKVFAQRTHDSSTKWRFLEDETKNCFRITDGKKAWLPQKYETAQIELLPYFEKWTDVGTVWELIPVDRS